MRAGRAALHAGPAAGPFRIAAASGLSGVALYGQAELARHVERLSLLRAAER